MTGSTRCKKKKTNIRLNKSFNLIFSLIFFKQLLQWNQTHVSELKSFKSLREDKLLLRLLCYLMNLQTGFFPATQQQVDLCCVVMSSQQHVARTLIQMIRLLLSETETKNVSERPLTSVHIYLPENSSVIIWWKKVALSLRSCEFEGLSDTKTLHSGVILRGELSWRQLFYLKQ